MTNDPEYLPKIPEIQVELTQFWLMMNKLLAQKTVIRYGDLNWLYNEAGSQNYDEFIESPVYLQVKAMGALPIHLTHKFELDLMEAYGIKKPEALFVKGTHLFTSESQKVNGSPLIKQVEANFYFSVELFHAIATQGIEKFSQLAEMTRRHGVENVTQIPDHNGWAESFGTRKTGSTRRV